MMKEISQIAQIKSWTDDHIGFIKFDRPKAKNAINAAMWREIPAIMEKLAADKNIRSIVLCGAGGCFSAGADISEFTANRADPTSARAYEDLNVAAFEAIANVSKPTIAMIDGFCLGGGLAVALACDLRIAADDAQFALPPARLGLAYPIAGIARLLSVVSSPVAKEMLFTAKRLNALEASRTGLVNQVTPADTLKDVIDDLCNTIATLAPLTITASKATIDELQANPENPDMKKLEHLAATCFTSKDYREGQAAFIEKRKPRFTGE